MGAGVKFFRTDDWSSGESIVTVDYDDIHLGSRDPSVPRIDLYLFRGLPITRSPQVEALAFDFPRARRSNPSILRILVREWDAHCAIQP
jgi:hypothetical protein